LVQSVNQRADFALRQIIPGHGLVINRRIFVVTTDRPQPAAPDSSKRADTSNRAKLHRFWPIRASTISIAIATVALLISYLTYQEQHNADLASAAASKQEYASQVSYWLAPGSSGTQLMVRNGSSAPILNVMAWVRYIYDKKYFLGLMNLSPVPACSVLTVHVQYDSHGFKPGPKLMSWTAAEQIAKHVQFPVQIERITFTDTNGRMWSRDNQGSLGFVTVWPIKLANKLFGWRYLDAPVGSLGTITPAIGC